jgi:hypothetical protein
MKLTGKSPENSKFNKIVKKINLTPPGGNIAFSDRESENARCPSLNNHEIDRIM